jgi:alkylation response protein AidB-like acyl-CoA dehydrogenase
MALIMEELSPADSSVALSVLIQCLGTLLVHEDQSTERRTKRLSRIINERRLLAFALSEARSQKFETKAEKTPSGYKVMGRKVFVNQAREADWVLVVAESNQGLGIFCVEKGAAGMMADKDFPRAAARGLSWAEIIFDEVAVGHDSLVGEPGAGESICEAGLSKTSPLVAAMSIGLVRTQMASLRKDRVVPALEKISGLGRMLAETGVELEAGRALCHECSYGLDKGLPIAGRVALASKIFASEMAYKFFSRLSEMAGAEGVVLDQEIKERLEFAGLMRTLLGSNTFLLEST